MASPSTMQERAGRAAIAATASGNRSARSNPFRVISRTRPASSAAQDAETVILDFVNPARPGRRLFRWARQARFVAPHLALQLTRYRHARIVIRIGGREESIGRVAKCGPGLRGSGGRVKPGPSVPGTQNVRDAHFIVLVPAATAPAAWRSSLLAAAPRPWSAARHALLGCRYRRRRISRRLGRPDRYGNPA